MTLNLQLNFKKIIFACVVSFFSFQLSAQMTCGTPDISPEEARALLDDLEILRRADVTPTGLITVPFQPHIVRTNAGTGGPNATNVMNNITAAQNKFLPYGITLDILPINYINNTDLMVLGTNGDAGSGYTEGDNILQLNNVANVVNAYFVDAAYGSSGGAIGGYARFPWNLPNDYFVVVNNSPAENGATVAHEMGHYFGLLHTFETANGLELVNGTNCGSTGDLLCDTPADGFDDFGDVNGSTCAYTSGTDSNGDAYMADSTQIMSYNQPFSCVDNFSADAETRMRFYMGKEAINNTRAYLFQPTASCSSYSAILNVGGTVTVTGANVDNGSIDPNGDAITLDVSPSSFTCSDIGDQTVTLTVTDPNGFTNTCTTTVTVSDNVALSAVCTSPTITLDGSGLATINPANIDGGSAVGNCGLGSEYMTMGFADNSLSLTNTAEVFGPGYMFDVTALNAITINSFDIRPFNAANVAGTANYEIYYKSGTWSGFQFNSSAWTLMASPTLSISDLTVTPLNLSLGIPVAAGETVAFYITTTDASDILFENGVSSGNLWSSDTNLQVYEGAYSIYPFAGTALSPFMFNGTIDYNAAVNFDGNFDCSDIGDHIITLNRKDNAGNLETCDATVTIEDAQDPSVSCPADFAVDSTGNFNLPDYYGGGSVTVADNCGINSVIQTPAPGTSLADGIHVISYLVTDANGNTNTCNFNLTVNDNTLSVNTFQLTESTIVFSPNPATDVITLTNTSSVRLNSVVIIDLNGRIIDTINLENMQSNKDINLSGYANGIYLMRITSEKDNITKRIVKY